jgi:predicted enzyme related to lactoylglutathione lyase
LGYHVSMSAAASHPTFFGPILLAKDFDLTVSFYRAVLGLPFEGKAPYAKCVADHSTISVIDGKWWAQVNGSDNPIQGESSVSDIVLTIHVSNLEEVFQRMMVTGVRFLSPPTSRPLLGIRNLFLRDPDGRSVMVMAESG